MKHVLYISCTLFGLLWVRADAIADVPPDLMVCPSIEDSGDRLACFDEAMLGLTASSSDTMPEERTPEGPRTADADATEDRGLLPSWFPKVNRPNPSGDDAVEDPDSYGTKIVKIVTNNLGRYFFTTEEGFVWRQIELRRVYTPRSLPADAVILQGAMGSTRLKILSTGRSYLVERVQ